MIIGNGLNILKNVLTVPRVLVMLAFESWEDIDDDLRIGGTGTGLVPVHKFPPSVEE